MFKLTDCDIMLLGSRKRCCYYGISLLLAGLTTLLILSDVQICLSIAIEPSVWGKKKPLRLYTPSILGRFDIPEVFS